jgi:hypothetical protein
VPGKGQTGIVRAPEEMRRGLPFRLQGIDSDNGSEFLNDQLLRYCRARQAQRVGSRLKRRYDAPQTPLDRIAALANRRERSDRVTSQMA